MARKRRLNKKYKFRRNPDGMKRNPPLLTDIAEFIVPGFASFAATRLLTRIATTQLAKRRPSLAKHAGAITSIGSFLAAWYGAHRVKFLEKHHTPIVVGAAIAGLQSLIQLYVPKLGWMIADSSPDMSEFALPAQSAAQAKQVAAGLEVLDDDPDEYTYNDSFDAGIHNRTAAAPAASEDDVIADLNLDDDNFQNIDLGSLGAS